MNKAGLYIHIPFCVKKCSYCDFFSLNKNSFSKLLTGENGSLFAKRLVDDIIFMKNKYNIEEWDTVYVGGGTPSLLSYEDIHFIFSSILNSQKDSPKDSPKEFTIELNPEDVNPQLIDTIYSSGGNRISLGIQSFSNKVLNFANRRGSTKKNIKAINLIKSFNKGTISCDLIAGLKGQNQTTIQQDIETLIAFKPEHISFYALCSNKPLTEVEEDNIADLWLFGEKLLEENNYNLYEISNFSYKNKFKSLHNQKYWKLDNYIGVGPGAYGSVFSYTSQNNPAQAERFFATKNIQKWITEKNRNLIYEYEYINQVDLIKETIMMGLRLTEGINLSTFKSKFNIDLKTLIPKNIEELKIKKMINKSDTSVVLSKKGRLFLNTIIAQVFHEIDSMKCL